MSSSSGAPPQPNHVPAASAPSQSGDDAVAALIPYRNWPALTSYYLGLFSLFPCLGAILGVAAFILGVMGLRRAARNPEAKGKVHAWIGVICGGLFGLAWIAIDIVVIIAMIANSTRSI